MDAVGGDQCVVASLDDCFDNTLILILGREYWGPQNRISKCIGREGERESLQNVEKGQ